MILVVKGLPIIRMRSSQCSGGAVVHSSGGSQVQ